MSNQKWQVNSDGTLDGFIQNVRQLYQKHGYVTFSWTTGRQRTLTQNGALHLWCRMTADLLNDAGMECHIDIPATGRQMAIPWNEKSVKDGLWRPVQQAMIHKKSTTEAERQDYGEIHKVLCARFAESFGVTLPDWPSKDNQPIEKAA